MEAILICILIIILLGAYGFRIRKDVQELSSRMSFKEAMELTELPIVTFRYKENKLNFLLDTGSNDSHISGKCAKAFDINENGETNIHLAGMGTTESFSVKMCELDLSYKNNVLRTKVIISPMLNDSFDMIKKEHGVQLHGILGTKFLEEHKYVLDFKDLTAYRR